MALSNDHQKTFGPCDDGALGEGYSDAVVTLFADRWDQFDAFVRITKRNPAFRRWAVGHIDATTSDTDLKKIKRNAARCRGDAKKRNLCKTIRAAASEALTETMQIPQE